MFDFNLSETQTVPTNPNVRHLMPRLVSVDVNPVDAVSLHGIDVLLMSLHEVDHLVTHLRKIRRCPRHNIR